MRPNILYHGTNKKLNVLDPRKPFKDKQGVYASSNKKLALAMGLTCQKSSSSFLSHDKVKLNFVEGKPEMKFIYLYHISPDGFVKINKDEYRCTSSVKPVKVERFEVSKLGYLWRKSNDKELAEFLKDRDIWKTPSS